MSLKAVTGKALSVLVPLMALGACAGPLREASMPDPLPSEEVMAELRARAAPYQDLSSVRLRPEDGCYWYRHVGPVETTMLPLRSVDGRSVICTGPAAPAPV